MKKAARILGIPLLGALLLPLLQNLTLAAASRFSDPAGIFTYVTQFNDKSRYIPVYQRALSESFMTGAALTVPWNKIEPQAGVFDWADFDRVMGYALQNHKKLTVGIVAGAWTPSWVYAEGAQSVTFSSYDRSPPHGVCTRDFVYPVVWDPIFLAEYANALKALATHLGSVSVGGRKAYDSVVAVKIAGIGLTTEEVRVNAHPAGGPCNEPDSTRIWQSVGFTPTKVLNAFMHIAADTAAIFPDKSLLAAYIHRGAFPPIDDNGNVYALPSPPNDVDQVTLKIINAAVKNYQSRLVTMWDALSQFRSPKGVPILPGEILSAGAHGSMIGWQTNEFMGAWGGAGCIYPPFQISACAQVEDYQSILDIGIDSGGRYLEVHAVDAAGMQEGHKGAPTDFAPAFQEAQHRLSCTKPSPTSLAFLQGTDCAPVVEACNKAGYYLGCQNFSLKGGLLGTCLGPIVFGRKSLPDVEVSSLEASACRNYCIQNPGRCN